MFNHFQITSSAGILILLFGILMALLFLKIYSKRKKHRPESIKKHRSRSHRRASLNSSGPLPLSKQVQSCSFCKSKVNPKELTFYAAAGKVVGVCRSCKPQAERQALLKL